MHILNPTKITDLDWKYYLSYNNPQEYIAETSKNLQLINRYFVDERFQKLLYLIAFEMPGCFEFQKTICSATIYRARIYKEIDAYERYVNGEKYGSFQGYDADNSGAPKPEQVKYGGRANPEGVSYLYAASECETAVLEIKAKPSEYVSVAEIEITKPLHILDLSMNWSGMEAQTQSQSNWLDHFVLGLNALFEKPCEEVGDYYLCQYICEYYKANGIEGIEYNSSMASGNNDCIGKNIVIFSPGKYLIKSSKLYHIKSLHCTYS